MSARRCSCCGAPLATGTVVQFVHIVDDLPHSRLHLYKLDRLDRDGRGIEWLFLRQTDEGKRLMVDLELAARWYSHKWPLVAERLRQQAAKTKPTGAITTEGAYR